MPVQRTITAPDHFGADGGQPRLQFCVIEHLIWEVARFAAQALQELDALGDFLLGQTQPETARLLQGDVHSRFFEQAVRKPRPQGSTCTRPVRVAGHPEAFALHPDQPEVAARCTERDIAFIEHGHAHAVAREAVGDCRADQAAANNDNVIRLHASTQRLG